MRRNMHQTMLAVAAMLFSLTAAAQPGSGGLPSDQVEVTKKFDAQLLETDPERQTPFLPYIDTSSRERQTFSIAPKNIEIDYPAPRLKPLAVRSQPKPPVYRGFVKAGFGTPMSPYAEAAYNFVQQKKADVGVYAKHHSAWPSSDALLYRRFNNTMGGVRGNVYLDNGIAVGGDINYGQRNLHYYGWNEALTDTLTLEQARQRFNLIDVNATAFNGKRNDSDFNYEAKVNIYRLSDAFAARETGADLRISGVKWFAEKHSLNIGIRTDFTSKRDTGLATSLNNFYFQPSFTGHFNPVSIKAGLNLVSHQDEFYFLPDVEANASLLGNMLSVFAGWKGDFQKNTFRSLSDYNPFISPYLGLRNTDYTEYFGGVKGSVKFVTYALRGSYGTYNNLAMYVTTPGDKYSRFDTRYDTVKVTKITANIGLKPVADLDILLNVGQHIYAPGIEAHAWGLPTTQVSASARYRLLKDKKLMIKGELFTQNGMWALIGDNEVQLNPMIDVNVGAEYWVAKNIAIFVEGNNLLDNRYQRWINYPQLGINALGGIVARF